MKQHIISEAPWANFLFNNKKSAILWLVLRIYVGWQWVSAGWEKLHSSIWSGPDAGGALSGFINGALSKASGDHPDVQ
jgi:thiosulfate dehydrogenase [quinone] large subunit